MTNPDGTTYQYSYDSANNLTGITIPGQGIITYTYQNNLPVTITYPGGSKRTLTYDSLMRLQGINVTDPAQNNLMNYQYNYDRMNNVMTKQIEQGNYSYQYDNLYQLTHAVIASPQGVAISVFRL